LGEGLWDIGLLLLVLMHMAHRVKRGWTQTLNY
jgi:hypothetical protein